MGNGIISPRQRQDDVNVHFQSQATYWKDLYSHADAQAEVHRYRFTTTLEWIDSLSLAPGSRVLDIGCGAGFLTVALAERGFHVHAIDAAQAMVDQTRQFASASNQAERVSVGVGDVQALGFEDNQFDLVVALGVIPWIPQPELAIQEMARVTRPDGYVLLSADNMFRLITVLDPVNYPALGPMRKQVKARLEQAGIYHESAKAKQRVIVTYHRPAAVKAILAHVGLVTVKGKTLGFGPFTLLGRPLLPTSLAIPLHRRLQRLADRGVPPFHSTGAQYLTLTQKSSARPSA